MTGTLVTLRPINVQSVTGWTAAGTGPPATVAAATNDDSDGTYATAGVDGASVIFGMTTGAVPALAQVRYVIPRYRADCLPSSAHAAIRLHYGTADDTADTIVMGQVPTSGSGSPRTVAPGGVALTATIIDGLEVKVDILDILSATEVRLFEAYLDVFYNEAPVVAVTAPAATPGTNQPTVSFTYCVDMETEALTRRGWLPCHELRPGDEFLTLNPDTGLAEWQPASRINRFPAMDREMIRMEGPQHSSLTTPNHRWLVDHGIEHRRGKTTWGNYQFTTSEAIGWSDRIPCSAPCVTLPTEPKWSDAFVELVGWYWTEGSDLPGKAGIRIDQSQKVNAPYVERIRACLTTMFGPPVQGNMRSYPAWSPNWREDQRRDGEMIRFSLNAEAARWLRRAAPDRVIDAAFIGELTRAQLNLLLETSIDADGHRSGNRRAIGQRRSDRLAPLQMVASLLGVRSNLKTSHTLDGEPMFCLQLLSRHQFIRPRLAASHALAGRSGKFVIERVSHSGEIWCPSVPNKTWLARRRGTVYFTGNTDPEGDAQERYRVVVHTTAATILPGFVIGRGGAGLAWDSGVVFGADTSVIIGLPLTAGVAYTAYVQAADAGSSGRYSAWAASGSFTPTISQPPATPTVTATADAAGGRVVLDVIGRNNLLSLENSTLATTAGDWNPGTNCASAVRSTTHAVEGAASLRLTSTAAGAMNAFVGSSGYPLVEPARVYTVLLSLYAPTGETALVHVDWRNAAVVFIASSDGLPFKTITGQFQQIRLVTTSPAGANTAAPYVFSNPTAGGEQQWVDVASVVTGYVNLLADNQSAFEAGSGGLTGTNCTIDNPAGAVPFAQGDRVARLTVTADGDAIASTPSGTSAFSAAVGETIGVLARFRAENAAAARTVSVYAEFFNTAGVSLGTSAAASGTTATSGFTELAIPVTAPANTATVSLHAKVASAKASETFRVDCLGLIPLLPGATTVPPWVPPPSWTAGGMAAISTATVERSLDKGATWTTLRGGAAVPVGVQAQEFLLYDYGAPMGAPAYYRVQGAATVAAMLLTTGRSANVAATVTPGDCDGWLKDPTDPTRNMTVRLPSGLTSKTVTPEFVSKPVGRDTFVVLGDTGSGGNVYSLTLAFQDDAEYAAFEVLRTSRRPLLLQTGFGDGTDGYEQVYVRLSEQVTLTRVIQDRAQGLAFRQVTIDAYTADPPA